MTKPRVFLFMPDYGGMLRREASAAFAQATRGGCEIFRERGGSSLLAAGFNQAYGKALAMSERRSGDPGRIDIFAMQHADVQPENGWLDVMVNEMSRVKADVLSAAISLRNDGGLTSLSVCNPDLDEWKFYGIPISECYKLPRSFSIEDFADREAGDVLCLNTGLMLVDLRNPLFQRVNERNEALVYFTIRDRLVKVREDSSLVRPPQGTPAGPAAATAPPATPRPASYEREVIPEDWGFSLMAHRQGARLYATTAVEVRHYGSCAFRNRLAFDTLAQIKQSGEMHPDHEHLLAAPHA